ncbi:hypothetical protein PV328_012249 [Microctonus aethiopoides]|uniref:Uncharacterized protein n=1 Tax=Microctonus aethiopoides TaxID=144406 RepID=A0AA39EWM9_9HYME|nr:hypothetical protein PV328_012249 [Microctonus aethiopoides]
METSIDIDKVLSVPVPKEQDPEMEKIMRELDEEIRKLANPVSPIRKRTVPVLNHRYPNKRGDWQLGVPDVQVCKAETKGKTQSKRKVRIRPYTGTVNNVLLNTVATSVPNAEKGPAKPRIRHTCVLKNKVVLKTPATATTIRPAPSTIVTNNTTTSATTTSTSGTVHTRTIPVITLEDDQPPGLRQSPAIPKPVAKTVPHTPIPATEAAKMSKTTPTTKKGKKKRKRNNRNKRHGLRYEREGDILYKWTKRGGKRERKVVENPIWRGPGLPPPNN